MTYTTRVKEEISKTELNENEKICELSGFIRFAASIKETITITLENAIKNARGKNALVLQMNSGFHKRIGKSDNNFSLLLPQNQRIK